MAPSRIRMRDSRRGARREAGDALSGMSLGLFCIRSADGFRAAGNQYGKGIAGAARADGDPDVGQAGVLQQLRELAVVEAEPLVAETIADPLLVVTPEVEQEHAAAGTDDADGFGERLGGIGGVVQRL